MKPKTVALYARISTKDKGQDTENQLKQMRAYCKRSKLKVIEQYVDKDSGRKKDRPALSQLFTDARLKKFDLVLVWSLDRFSREGVRETLEYLQKLESYDVAFRSLTEEYLDTAGPFREAIIAIFATLANQEAVKLSQRVKAGLERTKAKGTVLGQKPLTKKQRERILTLRKTLSVRATAIKVGVSVGSVSKVCNSAK